MISIDLSSVYMQAFGMDVPQTDASKIEIEDKPLRRPTTKLGAKLYMDDALGREHFLPVEIEGMLIPFAVVSIVEKKTIVSTAMPERGGSVKELISVDDYMINIKGVLINDNNEFPDEEITALHELFGLNRSVVLRNGITDIFLNGKANHRVVIKQISWPAVSGIEHAKPFEIECESDMIFDLEIVDE